jgi:TonB family protein
MIRRGTGRSGAEGSRTAFRLILVAAAAVSLVASRSLGFAEQQLLGALLAGEPGAAAVEQLILDGAYDRAESAARELLAGGSSSASLFALLALSEVKAGKDDDAVCRWQAAQLLDHRLETTDLSAYGAAGGFLSRHGLDSVDLPPAWDLGVIPPRRERLVPPRYTDAAKKARLQGIVVVQAIISETGAVLRPKVLKPMPMGLDLAALDSVCDWHFLPATIKGVPIPLVLHLTVNFKME